MSNAQLTMDSLRELNTKLLASIIGDVEPKYFNGWRRYAYEVKPADLMQNHWDYECSKTRTRNRSAQLIQNAYRNYRKRPETLAK